MSPALHRAWRKGVRSALQLVAGGALTALITALAGGLSPGTAGVIMAAWTVVVAAAQNGLEAAGKIPALLPTPGLVPSAAPIVAPVVGTVETTVDQVGKTVGDVSGVVQDVTGTLIGEVVPPGEGEGH